MLEFWDGTRLPKDIRELCGKCDIGWEWNEAGEVVPSSSVFLEFLYEKQDSDPDGATDLIFEHIDKALTDRNFARCDKILQDVKAEDLTSKSIRSLLTIMYPAKDKLPTWSCFFEKAEQQLIILRGEELTNKLIGRFR